MSEIEVKHLTKTFEQKGLHVEALKDINLTICHVNLVSQMIRNTWPVLIWDSVGRDLMFQCNGLPHGM